MLILAFEANSALSSENETKIVKITHSAECSGGAVLGKSSQIVVDTAGD